MDFKELIDSYGVADVFFGFFLKFQKRIMVPGILRAHVSIKQNAEFAAVSQYLWSIMGSTENPGIL